MARMTRDRRGSYVVILAATLVAFLTAAALAIDVSYIRMVGDEALNAADAAAHAAAVEYRRNPFTADVQGAAQAVVECNELAGTDIEFATTTSVAQGGWDTTGGFSESASYVNAVQVQVSRTSTGGNPVGLFLGPALGLSSSDVIMTSTAVLRNWEVVVVQDVGYHTRDVMDEMRSATLQFLDRFWNSPSDAIAMVTYTRVAVDASGAAIPWTTLTPLVTNSDYLTVESQWTTLDWCHRPWGGMDSHPATHMPRCDEPFPGSTKEDWSNPGDGIDLAVDELVDYGSSTAFQAIVLVTNTPPYNDYNGSLETQWLNETVAAADRADANDISVFVIYLHDSGVPSDAVYMEGLTRGIGTYYELSDPLDFPQAATEAAASVPIALVD